MEYRERALPSRLSRTVNRRTVLAAVPGLAMLAFGVACGGDDDEDGSSSGTEEPTSTMSAEPTATAASEDDSIPTTVGEMVGTTAAEEGAAEQTATSDDGEGGTAAGGWQFTDDRGITVSLPERPDRVVAQTSSAAALWDYGVRPVAIFGPSRTPDGSADFQAGEIDLDSVEVLGDYGEMDLEMLIALDADLYIDLALYGGDLWYLGDTEEQVLDIVPTLGISMQKVSILDSIERFEELSEMLGADLSAPDVAGAKAGFVEAEADLKAAIAEKPGLKVLVTSPTVDEFYVASPEWMTDLRYFRDLGLEIIDHGTDDFFELLSWEQANKYPADLILYDARSGFTPEQLLEIETWASLPAVQAGQVGLWYANAPYSHKRLVPIMRELTGLIRNAEPGIA